MAPAMAAIRAAHGHGTGGNNRSLSVAPGRQQALTHPLGGAAHLVQRGSVGAVSFLSDPAGCLPLRMPALPITPWMDRSAGRAGPRVVGRIVERVVHPRKVLDDAGELQLDAAHQATTTGAVPLEGILDTGGTRRLDDRTQAARFGALG